MLHIEKKKPRDISLIFIYESRVIDVCSYNSVQHHHHAVGRDAKKTASIT